MKTNRAKPGPKERITPAVMREIYAMLRVGASLHDCAEHVGVDYSTLYRKRQKDPQFAKGLMKAQAHGKMHLIRKVHSSKDWRAAAFMLERKYPQEFGRTDRIEQAGEVTVNHKGETTEKKVLDVTGFAEAFKQVMGLSRDTNGSTDAG